MSEIIQVPTSVTPAVLLSDHLKGDQGKTGAGCDVTGGICVDQAVTGDVRCGCFR
jgi:hypothetical protein